MGRAGQLVTSHLEGVSWRVFKQYPEVIQEMIKGHSGVYALYRRERLYYVGLASNLMRRLKQHLRDRHHGSWDRFSVYLTLDNKQMKEMESLLIRIAIPDGNRQSGKFVKSRNRFHELNKEMQNSDADRRARLLGGHVRKRRQRRKASQAKGTAALAGLHDRRRKLEAEYKGYIYAATLRKDGRISYDGVVYDSPTAAARAVVKRRVNGWNFWKFRGPKHGWIRLSELRR